jgi:hypothetical protein
MPRRGHFRGRVANAALDDDLTFEGERHCEQPQNVTGHTETVITVGIPTGNGNDVNLLSLSNPPSFD